MTGVAPLLRVYSVGGEHCFFLRLPDGDDVRHLLVDYGSIEGPQIQAATRRAVHADIFDLCKGRLDVVVVSSERRDALRGLLRGETLFDRCEVANVWMGMPSHPDHAGDGESNRLHGKLRSFAGDFGRGRRIGRERMAPAMERLVESLGSDEEGLEYARSSLGDTTWYLARTAEMKGTGLGSVDVTILAPEIDVGVYYDASRVDSRQLAAAIRAGQTLQGQGLDGQGLDGQGLDGQGLDGQGLRGQALQGRKRSPPVKPVFLSDAEWRTVRERRAPAGVQLLRAFRTVTDDCSLVFQIVVNGKRLLFLVDSGRESWNQMSRAKLLKPVDFLAAGEWTARISARRDLLDKILPKSRRTRAEVVVRHPGRATLEELQSRARVRALNDDATTPWFDIEI